MTFTIIVWEARGRWFESSHPDKIESAHFMHSDSSLRSEWTHYYDSNSHFSINAFTYFKYAFAYQQISLRKTSQRRDIHAKVQPVLFQFDGANTYTVPCGVGEDVADTMTDGFDA